MSMEPGAQLDKVSVGTTTVAGGGIGLVTFVSALVAVLSGSGTTEEIVVLVVGASMIAMVLGGRYAQAVAKILAAALERGAEATPARLLAGRVPLPMPDVDASALARIEGDTDQGVLEHVGTDARVADDDETLA